MSLLYTCNHEKSGPHPNTLAWVALGHFSRLQNFCRILLGEVLYQKRSAWSHSRWQDLSPLEHTVINSFPTLSVHYLSLSSHLSVHPCVCLAAHSPRHKSLVVHVHDLDSANSWILQRPCRGCRQKTKTPWKSSRIQASRSQKLQTLRLWHLPGNTAAIYLGHLPEDIPTTVRIPFPTSTSATNCEKCMDSY